MDELTIRRLAVIKQLYLQGMNQSYDTEPMNGFCLLSFHDSVEMFMKLCAENNGIKINRDVNFGDYFTKIPNLQCNATMTNLNTKRVNLKHYGTLPSKLDVEIVRANTTDFFEQNTPVFFNVSFDEISLISLIKYASVREYLTKALDNISSENFGESIVSSQFGFKELLYSHQDENTVNFLSPYKIAENFTFSSGFFRQLGLERELDEFVNKTKDSIEKLDEIVCIIGFGIDYKQYCKFKLLSPFIQVWHEKGGRKYESMKDERVICNKRNAQFCFDFVIDSALQLQRFSFDINELRS